MGMITLRLSGSDDSIDAVVNALRAMPGVDRAEEMGPVGLLQTDDDSSSAGLPDDSSARMRDVQIHAEGDAATERARGRAETAARDAGVVVEWLEPF